MRRAESAEFLPLLWSQDAANGEGHLRIGFLKRCTHGGDAVDCA